MFITVEGIDNSGKTSVIKHVREELERQGYEVVTTAEPSEHWTGAQVRRAIASETEEDPLVAFFLFMADRRKHIEDTIRPALEDDKLVVSDRFTDSTFVYQSIALEDHIKNPRWFLNIVMSQWYIEPDVTIYLDLPVSESLNRGQGGDVYEDEKFLKRVKENYEKHFNSISRDVQRVNATQPIEYVVAECIGIIAAKLAAEDLERIL